MLMLHIIFSTLFQKLLKELNSVVVLLVSLFIMKYMNVLNASVLETVIIFVLIKAAQYVFE